MVLALTKPGSVTELLGPLFTEVFMVPAESVRCRIDLSASGAEITRSSFAVSPWEKDSPLASRVSRLSRQLFIQSTAAFFGSVALEMMWDGSPWSS